MWFSHLWNAFMWVCMDFPFLIRSTKEKYIKFSTFYFDFRSDKITCVMRILTKKKLYGHIEINCELWRGNSVVKSCMNLTTHGNCKSLPNIKIICHKGSVVHSNIKHILCILMSWSTHATSDEEARTLHVSLLEYIECAYIRNKGIFNFIVIAKNALKYTTVHVHIFNLLFVFKFLSEW